MQNRSMGQTPATLVPSSSRESRAQYALSYVAFAVGVRRPVPAVEQQHLIPLLDEQTMGLAMLPLLLRRNLQLGYCPNAVLGAQGLYALANPTGSQVVLLSEVNAGTDLSRSHQSDTAVVCLLHDWHPRALELKAVDSHLASSQRVRDARSRKCS